MNIILASTSPRRQALLALADIKFKTLNIDIDESMLDCETPTEYIIRMANTKNQQAITQLPDNPNSDYLVISADTVGVLNNKILTKPTNKEHAFEMWQTMSDNTHSVWTAVSLSLVRKNIQIQTIWQDDFIEKTQVTFIKLTPKMMRDYWQTGEPIDKAGAYAIQGRGACFVKSICGNYTNVVGLPLPKVISLIDYAKHITQNLSNTNLPNT